MINCKQKTKFTKKSIQTKNILSLMAAITRQKSNTIEIQFFYKSMQGDFKHWNAVTAPYIVLLKKLLAFRFYNMDLSTDFLLIHLLPSGQSRSN
jgi:hypothetical protein